MSPPCGKQGRLGLSLFLGGGRFNQSLVRRPLFGEIRVSGSRVRSGLRGGWNSGALFFPDIDYGLSYPLFFRRKDKTVCYGG